MQGSMVPPPEWWSRRRTCPQLSSTHPSRWLTALRLRMLLAETGRLPNCALSAGRLVNFKR
jgi:hypothetical protein